MKHCLVVSVGWESGPGLAGSFRSASVTRLPPGCPLWQQSPHSVIGAASASKLTRWLLAGFNFLKVVGPSFSATVGQKPPSVFLATWAFAEGRSQYGSWLFQSK